MEKNVSKNQKEIDRREFLRQFVILSSLPLSVTFGCGPNVEYGPGVEYGPPPAEYGPPAIEESEVLDMTYSTNDDTEHTLYSAENVPVDAAFFIYFSYHMDESSYNAVELKDSDENRIDLDYQWFTESTILKAIPKINLSMDTMYSLTVNESAFDVLVNPIELTGAARAEFRTI